MNATTVSTSAGERDLPAEPLDEPVLRCPADLQWFNTAFVGASNSSTALNALTVLSLAASEAFQGIVISQ